MDTKFKELISLIRTHNYKPEDIRLVKKAWRFAKLAHTGQKRLSGEPYVFHELETAKILASWNLDLVSIIAGLLHDTVEDGAAKLDDVEKEFGESVVRLVDGVTKVSYLKLRGSREEEFIENLRKMFLAMAKDLRVVLVKLADRLHNMQTLQVLPQVKQKRIARETLEVYAPLAERLGMGEIKARLDDLSFPYVYPEEHRQVMEKSKLHYKKAEEHIKKMKRALLTAMDSEKIEAEVHGRKKHLYSLWSKMQRPEINWDFEKINDIVGLRILVEEISDCYKTLGIVHNLFKPVPSLGVSDFIAQPKPNGYKSIHTKVFGLGGRIVEIQITTRQFYEENEYGLAAHWHLSMIKSGGKISSKDIDAGKFNVVNLDKFKWVKQLADWQKEISDSREFLEAVRFDALSERIFVFSPKGDVFDLPLGATPIDYAYKVHTSLAEYIKGAKVDGKIVPLNYKLKSGQVIEILKSKNPKSPNSDWLDYAVTNQARREISKYLRKTDVDRK